MILPHGVGETTVHFDSFPSYNVFVRTIAGDRDDVHVFGKPKEHKKGGHWVRFDTAMTFVARFLSLVYPYVLTIGQRRKISPSTTPEHGNGVGAKITDLQGAVKRLNFESYDDPIAAALALCDKLIEEPFHFDEEHDTCNLRKLGLHFPLVHRDADLAQFERVLSSQYDTWKGRDRNSSSVIKSAKTLTYCGASGMGKTRMAMSLLESLQQRDCGTLDDLNRSVSVVMDCTIPLQKWEESSVSQSIAARLLYFFGMKYRGFSSRYHTYKDFVAMFKYQCFELTLVVDALCHLLPNVDDQHPAMLLLLFDEVNHMSNDHINAAMRSVNALWRSTDSPLMVVPCLFGTNPVSVYKTSALGDHNITPSLLEADDHAKILRRLMGMGDEWEPSPMLRVLLQDIAYNPRLLELSLFFMSQAGYLKMEQEKAEAQEVNGNRPITPPSLVSENVMKGPFDSYVSFKCINRWLEDTALEQAAELCRSVFMQVIDGIDRPNFMTAVTIVDEDCVNFNLFSTILGLAVFGTEVALTTDLGAAQIGRMTQEKFTVGDAVEYGWVLFNGESIVLPYAYLYKIFRSQVFEVGGGAFTLPALRTPGMVLSPANNEKQDLAATCYRLLLAKLIKKNTLSLCDWLCADSITNVGVVPSKLTTTTLRSRCQVGQLDLIGYEKTGAFVNAKSASSWDSAVIVEVELADGAVMPDEFCTGVAVGSQIRDELKKQSTWDGHDFDSPITHDKSNATNRADHLMVCIQSKRKTSDRSLTTQDIWDEYAKVRVFAEKIPFVFLIISDGKKPEVPETLRKQVAVVTDGDMEAFFGPVVGKRRKESK